MRSSAFAPIAGLLFAATGFAAEPNSWLRLASTNFELYTNAGEDAARNLIRRFEHLRTVLRPDLDWADTRERTVCIIAFRSRDEFQPYSPLERASGFFMPGDRRDFVVLDDPSAATRTAAHEFGHVVIAQSGLQLPPWLNEGLAELYSNVEGGQPAAQIVVGRFLPGRVSSLRRDGWIGLSDLVTAGSRSPVFTSPAFVESAYAESWLLAHMLVLDGRYRDRFRRLLSVLQTAGTAEAFATVYGKTIAQVEYDLRDYLETGQANVRAVDSGPPEPAQSILVERDADFDARLALAEMLGGSRERGEQARAAYRQLATDYPLRPEVEDGIVETYRYSGDPAQAAEHRARAALLHVGKGPLR